MAARRERERTWRERIRRWEQSGLGRKEFAEREGVHPSTLGWWRFELARRGGEQSGPVVALTRVTVTPTVATAALEVVVNRGAIVRVPTGFDAATLERLLSVLEDRR
jgi:hypothetical protein